MGSVGLIILCFTSFAIVKSQSCNEDYECASGCCYYGQCKYIKHFCTLRDQIKKSQSGLQTSCTNDYECPLSSCCVSGFCQTECPKSCFRDWQCTSGCCTDDFKCKPEYDYQCLRKKDNKCTQNTDCTSNCCLGNLCQETDTLCTPVTIPTFHWPTQSDDLPHYNPTDYDEDYDTSTSDHKGFSAGAYIGFTIAGAVLFFVKIAFWIMYCGRRRRVVLVRTRCVRRVAIIQDDQLQQEHERINVVSGPPGGPNAVLPPYSPQAPPPKYSPCPFGENTTENEVELSSQNSEEGNSVPQGAALGPPPAYTPNTSINTINGNTTQPNDQNLGQTNPVTVEDIANQSSGLPPRSEPAISGSASPGHFINSAPTASQNVPRTANPAQIDQTSRAEPLINIEG